MYIQRSRQASPYAAYQALLEQRGLVGERGKALRDPEPRLAQLSAPMIKSQMLANAKRFERLGGKLSLVLPTLGELAAPMQASLSRPAPTDRTAKSTADAAGTGASAATLTGTLAIALNAGTDGSFATLMSEAPQLRLDTGRAATAATLTFDKVALNATQMTGATLRGENIKIGKHATEADFGELTINGVTTTLGVFSGNDDNMAARFIADRINENQANTVTASVETNGKRITLASKVPGTAGSISIDRVTADSDGNKQNDTSAGFRAGDSAAGQDGGDTDFGSVTINGVTTTFGALSNAQQTTQSATQWLVDRLNANPANGFVASAGGADRDQVVLTSKTLGSESRIRIDQVTTDSDANAMNAGKSGFVAGYSAQGQDADLGVTDFGTLSIDGVKTTFGAVSNSGLTVQGAARYMVDRLNANSANPVVASLGGADQDRVVLTAKAAGSAGSFTIDRTTSDTDGRLDDDGFNGWVAGRKAVGQDAASVLTDFGSLTVNGITTRFGVLDGAHHTSQTALQYLVDRLNQTNPTLLASAQDGKLLLSSRNTGSTATLSIDAVTPGSDTDAGNDRGLGFAPGAGAAGKDGGTEAAADAEAALSAPITAGNPDETARSRRIDPAEVTRMLGKTGQVVHDLNDYLQSLKDEGQHLPKSVGNFHGQMLGTLGKEVETLARLGMSLKDDRLELDEASFTRALQEDPDATVETFNRLQQALEVNVGAQSFALDQMRAVAQSTSESASTISQLSSSLYKMEHRASRLSWILDRLQPVETSLREQGDRLKKLEADQESRHADRAAWPEASHGVERAAAPFGLPHAPVPEGGFPGANAGRWPGVRWPGER